MTYRRLTRVFAFLFLVGFAVSTSSRVIAAEEDADYLTRIKPLLRARCYACHGALKQNGGLRLDTVTLMTKGGDSGAAVVRGNASKSRLLARVSSTDADVRMPPAEEGDGLTAEQIAMLRRWIAAGARGPADEQPEADPKNHWAFQPIVRPSLPKKIDPRWGRNPIDAFVSAEHRRHGLKPQPEAERIVLLRRLYFDLLGVPPTAKEITAFENDSSPRWYERTVERLLDDPRHGERWARHWMDVWRYSDWWGLGKQLRNSQPHIWHWRDWIVESLNEDMPYDEMIRLMLAADESHPNDLDKLRATGYLARNWFLFNRPQWMEETVEHVSKGFLGLTMNCTKCHDHKFDPFSQTDFYRMRAFFEPYHVRIDVLPGETDLTRDGIPRAYDGEPDTPTYRYIRGNEKNPDKSAVIAPGVPEILAFDDLKIEPVTLPPDAWQPERRTWVTEAYASQAREKVTAAEAEVKKAEEKLAAARKNKTGDGKAAVIAAGDALAVAKANVDVARAESASVECRIDASRATWADAPEADKQKKIAAAVRAARQVAVEKARLALVQAERKAAQAKKDAQAAANKELEKARTAVQAAEKKLEAPIPANASFTRFVGAKWSATRFRESRTDDPTIPFRPVSTGRRTALAKWITDRRNPLTARVAVNQIWMRHMGRPLVASVFDFGRKGTPPTHPELLDWLAAEFMDHGWSMKHLHRVIMNSAVYRMSSSSKGGAANAKTDPDNRFWWRRAPIRLESQAVRDSLLSLSGTLDPTRGGPPVPTAQQASSTRRSLYFFHSNNERNLLLTTFDEALVKECYRREQSIIPQQALALTNSKLVLDASDRIAARLSQGDVDDAAFVLEAFAVVLGIRPNDAEREAGREALAAWRKLPKATVATARANFVWALINHNDFVTLR